MTDPSQITERFAVPPAMARPVSPAPDCVASGLASIIEPLLRGARSEYLPAMNACEVVARLPKPERVVLLLRTFLDLTNREAAEVLGIDEHSAQERYLEALMRLRAEWQKSPAARAFWRGQAKRLDSGPF